MFKNHRRFHCPIVIEERKELIKRPFPPSFIYDGLIKETTLSVVGGENTKENKKKSFNYCQCLYAHFSSQHLKHFP